MQNQDLNRKIGQLYQSVDTKICDISILNPINEQDIHPSLSLNTFLNLIAVGEAIQINNIVSLQRKRNLVKLLKIYQIGHMKLQQSAAFQSDMKYKLNRIMQLKSLIKLQKETLERKQAELKNLNKVKKKGQSSKKIRKLSIEQQETKQLSITLRRQKSQSNVRGDEHVSRMKQCEFVPKMIVSHMQQNSDEVFENADIMHKLIQLRKWKQRSMNAQKGKYQESTNQSVKNDIQRCNKQYFLVLDRDHLHGIDSESSEGSIKSKLFDKNKHFILFEGGSLRSCSDATDSLASDE